MVEPKKIGIVTVLYNSVRHLDVFVESLVVNSEYIGEIVFVDNNSQDNPEERLKRLDGALGYSLIRNDSNVGYSKAVNQGLHEICAKDYEFILVTNNDLQMKEGALATLLEDMANTKADVVGVPITSNGREFSLSNYYDRGKGTVVHNPKVSESELKKRISQNPTEETLYVHGGIILFNRSFFKKVGVYDEYLFFGGDESDFTMRILACKEPVRAVVSLRSYDTLDHFTHHDSRFKLLKARMIMRGETYVLMKHGYGIFSGKFHRKVLSLFSELGKGKFYRTVILFVILVKEVVVNTFYLLVKNRHWF